MDGGRGCEGVRGGSVGVAVAPAPVGMVSRGRVGTNVRSEMEDDGVEENRVEESGKSARVFFQTRAGSEVACAVKGATKTKEGHDGCEVYSSSNRSGATSPSLSPNRRRSISM